MTDTEKHLEGGHGSASVSTLPAGTDLKRRESHAHEYGTEVEMERNFSFLSCLGLAFAMLNSWNAMTASLQLTLPSGGPVAVVWGLLVAAFGTMMNCISFAEVCNAFPMSGGQYDWTYIIVPAPFRGSLSFFVGWMATAGWISLAATASQLGANYVAGIIALWHPSFEIQTWQFFLLYVAFTLSSFLLNAFAVRLLPLVDRIAGLWGFIGFVTVAITLLACSSGDFNSGEEVFTTFTNETGWPDGMAFMLGLLQSFFGLTGFEAVSHMIEEMPQPSKNAPKVMMTSVLLGSSTAWIFLVIYLFVAQDLESVMTATTGPVLAVYHQATSSRTAATCLVMFNLGSMLFAGQGLTTIASRMVWSFARDRGMGPASPWLGAVHPTFKSPLWSVVFVAFWILAFGCISLGSSVALNAIVSASVVLLQISYIVPMAFLIVRGGDIYEGYEQSWSLGRWRRPINIIAMAFLLVTTVCFIFPPFIPVAGSTMNYVIVVIGIVAVLCGATWVIDGRKRFHGPGDLEERLAVARSAS